MHTVRPHPVIVGFALVGIVALSLGASAASAQTVVTTCGQEVSGDVVLAADLDCTGVELGLVINGGKLAMNGHSISNANDENVRCTKPCTIVGPGLITGALWFGVNALETSVHMQQVDVTNCHVGGVQAWKKCVLDGPATISGNGVGVRGGKSVKANNVTITGNQGPAIDVASIKPVGAAVVKGCTITGNGSGISAQSRVKVTDSTITGNGVFGASAGGSLGGGSCVRPGSLTLKGSIVTGNDTDPDCGTPKVCADVVTCILPPRIKFGSTCDHSYVNESGNPGQDWGVCALD
jgi:hypothetical protein